MNNLALYSVKIIHIFKIIKMSDNKTVDEINNIIKDLSIYSHADIIDKYDDDDIMWYIILEKNGKKEKKFLFSHKHDKQQLPRNSGVDAITDFPIGRFDDFAGYFADIPIDSKVLGITHEYIINNIGCYTDDELIMYYLIINYNNKNYCFYLEDDKEVLIDYLLNEQYFHYIELNSKYESFYEYLEDKYDVDDAYTQCMTLLSY